MNFEKGKLCAKSHVFKAKSVFLTLHTVCRIFMEPPPQMTSPTLSLHLVA